jgi:hypothetical protein
MSRAFVLRGVPEAMGVKISDESDGAVSRVSRKIFRVIAQV